MPMLSRPVMSATLVTPRDSAMPAAKLAVSAAGTNRSMPSTLYILDSASWRRWILSSYRAVTARVRGSEGGAGKIRYILDCCIWPKSCSGLLQRQQGTRDHLLLIGV